MTQREVRFRVWWKRNSWDLEEGQKPKMLYFDALGYCDEYNHLYFRLSDISREPEGGSYSNLGAEVEEFSDLMQFTGLRDSKGQEIYEGDVVKHRLPGYHDFATGQITIEPTRGICVTNWPIGFDIEVIGNIFETPSLLEQASR